MFLEDKKLSMLISTLLLSKHRLHGYLKGQEIKSSLVSMNRISITEEVTSPKFGEPVKENEFAVSR